MHVIEYYLGIIFKTQVGYNCDMLISDGIVNMSKD